MELSWIYWLLGTAVFVALVPYILGPIFVFFVLRFRVPPTIVEVDPRQHPLPSNARAYFSEAYQALTAEGFELVGTMGLPDLMPNAQTLFALYANRATADMAMSAIIVAKGGAGAEMRTNYVEFIRRFDDGVVVQTNNSAELSAFRRMPKEFTSKFWEIRDIRRLYKIHQLLAERLCQRGQPTFRLDSEFHGDAVQFVSKIVLEETFRDQVGTGYLAETAGGFRPTIKGALIMAWQELWPAKALRRSREQKRAAAILRKLKSATG